MGPNDTALLAELAQDINSEANDFPSRGKFQRRAHRLLNYTKRRVPGIQTRSLTEPTTNGLAAAEPADGALDEFDLLDEAVESLLTGGLISDGTPLGFFRNQDVRTIVTSFGELPVDLAGIFGDPDQLWNPISDAISARGIADMRCDTFGVDLQLRSQKPGLDALCSRLEGFPDFSQVENVLSGELIGQLFEALDGLTITENAAAVSQASKSTFCSTWIGQQMRFDSFCGR
jgi:hypothetical protein